jgi:hypothetical protein
MPNLRHVVLGLALVATAIASLVDLPGITTASDEPDVSAQAPRGPASKPAQKPVEPPVATAGTRFGLQVADLFAVRRGPVAPALPAASAIAAAPVPRAPPLPFQYQGKLLEQDAVVAFLNVGARTYIVRKGDVVADYRVVNITAADMTFLYLPLNEQQRLNFGSAN